MKYRITLIKLGWNGYVSNSRSMVTHLSIRDLKSGKHTASFKGVTIQVFKTEKSLFAIHPDSHPIAIANVGANNNIKGKVIS